GEFSIAREFAATHPHSERTPGHPPPSHRSLPQPSPPPSPESAPPSLSTLPLHRPCRTCTQTASAAPPATPHPSHTAPASHPCSAPTRSSPRQALGPTQSPRP